MNISLLGDIAFTGILSTESEKNIDRFRAIASKLKQSDLVFANLEVPIKIDETINENKNFIHYSLPLPTEKLLNLLNIGCVSLANNHIYDCKMPGLKSTIEKLDSLGIYHTGAGWKVEHIEPVIIKKGGCLIAFLAYVDKNTNPNTEHFPELLINYFDAKTVEHDVKQVKDKVDKVICSIHWGEDYSFYPKPKQIEIARELIKSGVDIIMGHHPHTLQPYEKFNDGIIFYSLGGLTFGDYIKKDKDHLIALFKKTKKSVLVNYNLNENVFNFITTHELKGNYIKITNRSFEKWNRLRWNLYMLKYLSPTTERIFTFKEKVLDRIIEYFFGYYQNPIKRLFQLSNIRKFKRLIHSSNNRIHNED